MYYLYLLKCADKTIYAGITVDLARRIKEHNFSKMGAKYTRARRPVKLVFVKKFRNRSLAASAENKMKKLSRAEKLAVVRAVALGDRPGKNQGLTKFCFSLIL